MKPTVFMRWFTRIFLRSRFSTTPQAYYQADGVSRTHRIPVSGLASGQLQLPSETARYVARVLRLQEGSEVVAFDPAQALEAEARVLLQGKHQVALQIAATRPATLTPAAPLGLVQAVGKGDKPERVVRAATALGVTRLWFANTERAVVQLDERRAASRRQRLAAVSVEAARQCGRGDVPELLGPLGLAEVILDVARFLDPGGLGLVLDPRSGPGLYDALSGIDRSASVVLVVGAEGGLTGAELTALRNAGLLPARIGELVLRTELAADAGLGAVAAWRVSGSAASAPKQSPGG